MLQEAFLLKTYRINTHLILYMETAAEVINKIVLGVFEANLLLSDVADIKRIIYNPNDVTNLAIMHEYIMQTFTKVLTITTME